MGRQIAGRHSWPSCVSSQTVRLSSNEAGVARLLECASWGMPGESPGWDSGAAGSRPLSS